MSNKRARIVIRMQNADGKGPYTGYLGSCDEWISMPHDSTTGHPTPNFDGFPEDILTEMRTYYNSEWLCGFKDYEQAYAWFSEAELNQLEKLGFTLCTLRAKCVVEGGHQVLFKVIDE